MYTIVGLFLGWFISLFCCYLTDISFVKRGYVPISNADSLILFSSAIGALIGFGYGIALLSRGMHPLNKLINYAKEWLSFVPKNIKLK